MSGRQGWGGHMNSGSTKNTLELGLPQMTPSGTRYLPKLRNTGLP